MLHSLKRRLYFAAAYYFGFWARIVLMRWKPRIVVITGSTGKTTLLHLVEAQIGDRAVYSHHANSALGVPFHILGLPSNVEAKQQWLGQIIKAPLAAWRKVPSSKLYIVEADCDRPHEGKFLSGLLKPEVTLWISVFRTHSMNFDRLVPATFATHEQAIAYEFGHFAAATKKLVIANGDQLPVSEQLTRVSPGVKVIQVSAQKIQAYAIKDKETVYTIGGQQLHLSGLHPQELGMGLQMVQGLLDYLDMPLDVQYQKFVLPPGRSSVFAGIKGTTLIDSTYNTGLGATEAILALFCRYPAQQRWLVISDILEQGSLENDEHKRLAAVIAKVSVDRIVLLGPRTKKYTYPILQTTIPQVPMVSFENPKEVLDYLTTNLRGGETVLFKGARFLEGVIEQLLLSPGDAEHLVRRGTVWTKRRQQWGLPK